MQAALALIRAGPLRAPCSKAGQLVRRARPSASRTRVGSLEQADEACEVSRWVSTPVGALHLIMGPMFAGKTTALLQRVQAAERQSLRVAVVNSAKDTRYGENVCASHNGVQRAALAVSRLNDLHAHPDFCMDSVDVIAIDESQFFPDLHDFCLEMVEVHGKTVIAAGLHGDFRRDKFGGLVNLVPLADQVEYLTARCAYCEHKALFTLRIAASDAQQLVGGADVYAPVCRRHYLDLHGCRSRLPQ